MSYRAKRARHWMSVMGILLDGDRYAVCGWPGCYHVRRAASRKPLIHKGRKS